MSELGRHTLIGEGREAEVYEWGDERILRLLRLPERREEMDRSVIAMHLAYVRGLPVPQVHDVVTIDGRPGIVMDRIHGVDMTSLLSRRVFSFASFGRTLGRLHAGLHEIQAPAELVSLHDYARERITLTGSPVPAYLARFALNVLDELPEGDCICHGDFHPGNVLMAKTGPMIIDWTNAARGDPAGDFARTRVLLGYAAMPPGASSFLRRVDRYGRGLFRRVYERAYLRSRPLDPALVRRWEIVRIADRFSEGIEEEFPGLLRGLAVSAQS